jgi:hypothetical protein
MNMQYSVYDAHVQTRLIKDPELEFGKLCHCPRLKYWSLALTAPPSLLGPCGFIEGPASTSTQSTQNELLHYLYFFCSVFYNNQYF